MKLSRSRSVSKKPAAFAMVLGVADPAAAGEGDWESPEAIVQAL